MQRKELLNQAIVSVRYKIDELKAKIDELESQLQTIW